MAFEESGRKGAAQSPWPLAFDTSNPDRCTSPDTLQTWTAQRREGGLIFCSCSKPWQTPKEQGYKPPAVMSEAYETPLATSGFFFFFLSSSLSVCLTFLEQFEDYCFKSQVLAVINRQIYVEYLLSAQLLFL